jgi:regulator of replication initiation timing
MTTEDKPTLRQTERDLYAAATDLREDDAAAIREEMADLEAEIQAADDIERPADIPAEKEQQYQQLRQALRETYGTADTYEHYADQWTDGEACVFVLEELNGDEYAATIDAVSQEAAKQARQDGSLPEGYGKIKALEYGVVDIPDGCPADPGVWPAPVVNELFDALQTITAPEGVDLGNASLAAALNDSDEGVTAAAVGDVATVTDGEAQTPAAQPPSDGA